MDRAHGWGEPGDLLRAVFARGRRATGAIHQGRDHPCYGDRLNRAAAAHHRRVARGVGALRRGSRHVYEARLARPHPQGSIEPDRLAVDQLVLDHVGRKARVLVRSPEPRGVGDGCRE